MIEDHERHWNEPAQPSRWDVPLAIFVAFVAVTVIAWTMPRSAPAQPVSKTCELRGAV
jgi:hypothetical protein